MISKIALLLCTFAVVQLTLAEQNYTQVVQLKNGKVKGLIINESDSKKVEFFQAIRYGTVARFEKPHPVGSWSDVYEATKQQNICPQFGTALDPSMKKVKSGEDCLFLNVYRPAEKKAEKREVMVWIHGGAFEMGSILSPGGQHFPTDEGIIFVSIAYRLGPLGFITGGDVPANLGLHDQILALKWVQENIEAFGGDPKKVTIFGESAGGMSVGALVLSPLAKGLFNRAIAQSGSPLSFSESLTNSFERTKKFAKKVNCTVDADLKKTIQCIKGKSLDELVHATFNDLATNNLFVPVYGDELLPTRPTVALQTGQFNHVDFMYGVTKDEGTVFIPMLFPELGKEVTNLTVQSTKEYIVKIMTLYGKASHGQEVADFYTQKFRFVAHPSQDDFKVAISNVWGDMNIVCPSTLFGQKLAEQLPMTKHVYAYRLMQAVPNFGHGFGVAKWMGVTHGEDVVYLFLSQFGIHDNVTQQLSLQMRADWTSFAKNGHPEHHLWRESFHREVNDFSTRYLHLQAGLYMFVSGHFIKTCDQFWKPIIFA